MTIDYFLSSGFPKISAEASGNLTEAYRLPTLKSSLNSA
jgi:hypothetical protein